MGHPLGNRGNEQDDLFVTHQQLRGQSHPFYKAVNRILAAKNFDRFVEGLCKKFYSRKMGRTSVAPGVYFRCLLLGYFEGIDSERGIAWRAADSLSLREFLGIPASRGTPDHSTLSKTRKRIDLETHREVFTWMLGVVADEGLLHGKTIGVDATTLEANAAMRSIVRRDDGRTYQEYLTELAKASGIATPSRADLARMDRKRDGRKTSNKDWVNPNDPDAEVTKMKDGRTHLAHKQEHAVDMESGAIVAVTIGGGAEGDTSSIEKTVAEAETNLDKVRSQPAANNSKRIIAERIEEAVADKGYHAKEILKVLDLAGYRTYIPEPKRGRRHWEDDDHGRIATYKNRRRTTGIRGKRLMRRRGELIERSFAHMLETGGMRRSHLRMNDNILKRTLVHSAAFNLGLVMRKLFSVGKPRVLQGRRAAAAALCAVVVVVLSAFRHIWPGGSRAEERRRPIDHGAASPGAWYPPHAEAGFSTGC